MKSNADTGSTPPPSREPDSNRERAASSHPPPAAKIPSWRPTVPGVQPRPTLHGVQPLITLRGLSAPTEHDLPVRRDTPQDPVEVPFEALRFGAPRVPADLALSLDEPRSERFEDSLLPPSGSNDADTIRAPENYARAERVRRWGVAIAVGLGSFALVLAGFILVGSLLRPHEQRATSPALTPVSTAPRLGDGETVPPPPATAAPSPESDPSPLPEAARSPLAPPPTAAPAAGREAPAPIARADAPKPVSASATPTRPTLFSQVPVRPGAD